MSELDAMRALLVDAVTRVHELVEEVTDGLDPAVARFRPDAEANPVGWLVWHLTRVQDDHVAGLSGQPQAWPDWRGRFGLPYDDDATGYGQSAEEVGAFDAPAALLSGYHAQVHAATLGYLDRVDAAELGRVVDEDWDPPVTAGVRLVSVLGDTLQHLGQASYVVGLAERAGVGQAGVGR